MRENQPLRCRKAIMRLLVQLGYKPESNDRNIQSIYNLLGKYLSGVTYKTFDNYQNEDGDDLSDVEVPRALVLGVWTAIQASHQKTEVEYPKELLKRLGKPIEPRKKRGKPKKSKK